MNKYVIIDEEAIQKRIEELKKELKQFEKYQSISREPILTQIEVLKQILSQSTPAIAEIEKAFDAGDNYRYWENNGSRSIPSYVLDKDDYIKNLKLDI